MNMGNKHAYLIIAHKNDYTLSSLLKAIDNENNDIFLHMDKKNKKYTTEWASRIVKKKQAIPNKTSKCCVGGIQPNCSRNATARNSC